MFCRVRLFVYPGITRTRQFCEFCKKLRTSYPYQGMGYAFVEIPEGVMYSIIPNPISSVRLSYPTESTRTLQNIVFNIYVAFQFDRFHY